MMSTGLTFGTISALYGLTNGIITQSQYSYLVAAVIGTAVIPTLIASLACVPQRLLPAPRSEVAAADAAASPTRLVSSSPETIGASSALFDVETSLGNAELLAAAHEELDLEEEQEEEVVGEG